MERLDLDDHITWRRSRLRQHWTRRSRSWSWAWSLLLCTACSASRSEPGTVRAGELPRTREGYVLGAEHVRLFYRIEGAGADTIVVLHGGPGLNLEGLRPDLGPLARRHTVIYFDQRGSGHSEMPDTLRLSADLMVKDLEAVRRAFRIGRMTLLGHSWGGGLAVLYAAEHPEHVARMLLVGPVPPRPGSYLERYSAAQAARRDSAEAARQAISDSIQRVARDPYPRLPSVDPNLPARGRRHTRSCLPDQRGSLRRDANQPATTGSAEPQGMEFVLGPRGGGGL